MINTNAGRGGVAGVRHTAACRLYVDHPSPGIGKGHPQGVVNRGGSGEMPHDASPIGLTGDLVIATRGELGPGEVRVAIRGGTELFLAYSAEPLARSSGVLIVGLHGARGVDVEPWGETLTSAPGNHEE